jgi:hypothetical protein
MTCERIRKRKVKKIKMIVNVNVDGYEKRKNEANMDKISKT